MKTVHIVAHTHWDREWYFTTQDALLLSDQIFTNAIETLENDPKAQFCLDGQTSVVEEYLTIRPDMEDRLVKLVQEGRMTVGPWYTQTDCLYVDGESIIRNLCYGLHQAKLWGDPMKVAYLPDTFGFNVQMPTIIANCGVEDFIFRRGFELDEVKDSYFRWKGLSEKQINTVHLLYGYGMAYGLNTKENFRNERLFPYIKEMEDYTKCDHILVCAGGDQVDIIDQMDEKIKVIDSFSDDSYIQSNYPEFFDATRDYYKTVWSGELRTGHYDRVHRTIGSIRYDIKKVNNMVEKKLLYRAEPLMAIGSQFGIKVGTELLYKAWKLLMEGQAHDGMGGCITDEVSKQVIDRFMIANEIADCIENLVKYRLAEKLKLEEKHVMVFNTDAKPFNGYKVVDFMTKDLDITIEGCESFEIISVENFEGKKDLLIEHPHGHEYVNEDPYFRVKALVKCELPAMGFKVFNVVAAENTVSLTDAQTNKIENSVYEISFADEKVRLVNKTNNEVIEDLLFFEDVANDGDTYDFSPVKGDEPIFFNFTDCKVKTSNNIQTLTLTTSVELPRDLEDRANNANVETNTFELEITLTGDDREVKCRLVNINNSLSHRVRLAFRTNIETTKSIASVPFGFFERKIQNGEMIDWYGKYEEAMIDIEVLDETVALSDDNKNFTLLTKGIKEYQVLQDTIYMTLYSATGQLGKPNLAYRPGRASGDTTKLGHVMIPTPAAQMSGEQIFEFSFIYDAVKFDKLTSQTDIKHFNLQSVNYQRQTLNKFINRLDNKLQADQKVVYDDTREFSLFNLNIDGVELSSISQALVDQDAYLIRIKNYTDNNVSIENLDLTQFASAKFTNAACEEVETPAYVGASDFVNILVKF